jgi:hypothetical protein
MRNAWAFAIGLMLGALLVLSSAHAETIAATAGSTYAATNGTSYTAHGVHFTGGQYVTVFDGAVWVRQGTSAPVAMCSAIGAPAGSESGSSGSFSCGAGWSGTYSGGTGEYRCTGATATLSGTTCTAPPSCPSGGGWTLSGNSCERPEACTANETVSSGYYDIGTSPTARLAGGGCAMKPGGVGCSVSFEGTSPAASRLVNGVRHYYAQGAYYADSIGGTTNCTTGATPATAVASLPSDGCGSGKTPGLINGKTVCFSLTDGTVTGDSTTTKTTTATQGGGSTTVENNADGTITTTVTDAAGNSTTTRSGEARPTSSFGGSCGAAFTCDGDAVQCAIAQEQHSRNCEMFTEGTESAAGRAMMAGTDGVPNPAAPANRESVVLPTTLDSTGFLGGGACPADPQFSVMGRSFTVPLSRGCDWASIIGAAMVAATTLVGGRIVFGG